MAMIMITARTVQRHTNSADKDDDGTNNGGDDGERFGNTSEWELSDMGDKG